MKQVFTKFRKQIEEKDKIILEMKTKLQRAQEIIYLTKNIIRDIKERHKTVKKTKTMERRCLKNNQRKSNYYRRQQR